MARLPATVLIVDDQDTVLLRLGEQLEARAITVVSAKSTGEALQAVRLGHVDVALIDWRLGGQDDGIALGRYLLRDYRIPFVLFSGYLNTEITGWAYKHGAADVIDKPIHMERLLAALELALCQGRRGDQGHRDDDGSHWGANSISQRWAAMVLRACRTNKDPAREADVAGAAGVSTSVFRRECRGCQVGALATRDLVRFLRANSRSQEDGSTLRSHLATCDPRTRARLFARAGIHVDARFVPLRSFLLGQNFVPSSRECLQELAHLAANDPYFLTEPDGRHAQTARPK